MLTSQCHAVTTTDRSADALFALLSDGGGEMGGRIRRYDWTRTSLGPIEGWSHAFRTALRLCMASRLPAGIYWGPEHIFLYNDAHRANLGHKHPDALGQAAAAVWPEVFATIEPLIDRCFRRGETCGADELPLLLSRAGFLQEVYFSFSYEPLINEHAEIEAVYAVIVNASKRVIADRRLRTLQVLGSSERHCKSPAEALALAAQVISQNAYDIPFASLYLWNDNHSEAGLCGVSNLVASGPVSPATISPVVPGVLAELASLSTGNGVEIREVESCLDLSNNGGWRTCPVKIAMLPLSPSAAGAPVGFAIIGLNPHAPIDSEYLDFLRMLAGEIAESVAVAYVSQREAVRSKALAVLDEAQTTFFGNVSHELRTPLTLMLGPLEETLEGSTDPLSEAQRGALTMVRRNGLQLLKLVNEVLDFARDQSNRLQELFEPVNLAATTTQLASSFEWSARRKGIAFRVECEDLLQPVYIDPEAWRRVVLNLLSNAFKYTLQGEVRLVLRKREHIELIVSDSGVGIPPRELQRIFERYHRVEGTRGGARDGSGIGLALVKEFAEKHGGTVTVHSRFGEGSTFTVSIPAVLAYPKESHVQEIVGTSVAVATPLPTERSRPQGGHSLVLANTRQARNTGSQRSFSFAGAPDKRRLLLVDDNLDMHEYLGEVLREHFEVETAVDGREALASAASAMPDVVVADVMMPNLDGLALLRELRCNERTRAIPVILLSARAGEESRIQGLEHGADDYLAKPFSTRELIARANSAIHLAQLRAQVAQQDERVRIARDLHDTLLQSVQGTSFLLDAGLQKLSTDHGAALGLFRDAKAAVTRAIAEGREVLSLLRSSESGRNDLVEGLQRLGRELLGETRVRFSVEIVGHHRELQPRVWSEVYAICRQAIANVARHANAHSSVLRLSYLNDFEVVIRDDGKGMSAVRVLRGRKGHFGLQGMRERAASLGAQLLFESSLGEGTSVILIVPGRAAYSVQPGRGHQ